MSPFWILLELQLVKVVVTTGATADEGGGDNWSYS